jgi:hypothetical protein
MQDKGLVRSPLSAIRITLLAFVTSTVAAVGMLLALRGLLLKKEALPADPREIDTRGGEGTVQPAVETEMDSTLPHHFSEDLIIPGFIQTGVEVEQRDAESGRSPEGV